MSDKEEMMLGLQVWWVTFGMNKVSTDELIEINAIYSGFIWESAVGDGVLSKHDYGNFALTPKAITLIKEYEHGH